jgi:hypothetical protein
MFRLFRRKTELGDDLLLSELFDESTFYGAFINDFLLLGRRYNYVLQIPYDITL